MKIRRKIAIFMVSHVAQTFISACMMLDNRGRRQKKPSIASFHFCKHHIMMVKTCLTYFLFRPDCIISEWSSCSWIAALSCDDDGRRRLLSSIFLCQFIATSQLQVVVVVGLCPLGHQKKVKKWITVPITAYVLHRPYTSRFKFF